VVATSWDQVVLDVYTELWIRMYPDGAYYPVTDWNGEQGTIPIWFTPVIPKPPLFTWNFVPAITDS